MASNLHVASSCIAKRKSNKKAVKIWWSFNRNESMDKREKIHSTILLFVDVV